jgi:hypothetical protein
VWAVTSGVDPPVEITRFVSVPNAFAVTGCADPDVYPKIYTPNAAWSVTGIGDPDVEPIELKDHPVYVVAKAKDPYPIVPVIVYAVCAVPSLNIFPYIPEPVFAVTYSSVFVSLGSLFYSPDLVYAVCACVDPDIPTITPEPASAVTYTYGPTGLPQLPDPAWCVTGVRQPIYNRPLQINLMRHGKYYDAHAEKPYWWAGYKQLY